MMAKERIPPPEAALEALTRELFRLAKEQHLRDMTALGLRIAQGTCLTVVGTLEPVAMGQLADYLALSSAAATSLVDRLVQSGWVVRAADHKDRRIVRVRLTPEGRSLFERLKSLRCNRLRERIDILSPREQQTLLAGLGLLVNVLSADRLGD